MHENKETLNARDLDANLAEMKIMIYPATLKHASSASSTLHQLYFDM